MGMNVEGWVGGGFLGDLIFAPLEVPFHRIT